MLTEWATVTRDRDNRVRAAAEAGVSRYRIEQLTGLAKTTIIRILRADGPERDQETLSR
jgi:predicted transcriptional regulator